MSNSINGINSLSGTSLQGLDLETALVAIQSQRASLLEGQLTEQLEGVQKKNEQIGQLNEVLNSARAFMASLTPEQQDAKSFDEMDLTDEQIVLKTSFENSSSEASISVADVKDKNTLDAFISNTKTNIDTLSNSQQMDMLRLQSLSNKRNEAFDLMTNFVKKMQDNRSSIIGNMR